MNFTSKIITSIILINLVFVFFVTNYVLKKEQRAELNRLNEVIKQDKKVLYKINSSALYDLDVYTLNTNLKTFFNNENIVKIEIRDNIGIHLNFEDDKYNKKDTIKSVIKLDYNNEKLGFINVYYTKTLINKQYDEFKKEVLFFYNRSTRL